MTSGDFPENGYRDLVDFESIARYFMVQIIMNNSDFNVLTYDDRADPGSIFFYKDKGGKVCAGPLWDFDRVFDFNPPLKANTYPYPNYPFFKRFFQDPVFQAKWKVLWNDNYNTNIVSMSDFINVVPEKIKKSITEDNKRWGRSDDFDSRINSFIDYFNSRIVYLNLEYNK